MPRARRNFVAVDNRMPRHPKVEPLSDAAFRLLITLWCECDEHESDGKVKASTWARRGTAKARRELLDAGMAEPAGDDFQMHDYLDHQRSAAEIHELREKRSVAGSKGGKARALAIADAKQTPQQEPQHVPRQTGSKAVAETGTEDRDKELTTEGGSRPETLHPATATKPPPTPPHDRYRCTAHQGVANPPPCNGCRVARERADTESETAENRDRDRRQRELEAARNACTDCDGVWLTGSDGLPTGKKCTHPTTRRTA